MPASPLTNQLDLQPLWDLVWDFKTLLCLKKTKQTKNQTNKTQNKTKRKSLLWKEDDTKFSKVTCSDWLASFANGTYSPTYQSCLSYK